VALQRLHSNLAPIDLLTREELEQTMDRQVDRVERERLRGMVNVGAIGTADPPFGPEQGYIWNLRHAIVKSNVFGDTATYTLFRGSTPSDFANSYTWRFLLDGIVGGATTGQHVNQGYYPGNKAVYVNPGEQIYALVTGGTVGNQYSLDGEAFSAPAEMKGKLM
jgi:hypothetical protein